MSYSEEYKDVLRRTEDANPSIRGLRYFTDTAAWWHARYEEKSTQARNTPRVVVLGHGIPEQLVHACGATPYYIMGGSHASCQWSDEAMPRDADPVSRSILGYALKLVEHIAQTGNDEPLFVVPIANDNMRKIAYHLAREEHEVIPVDIPPEGASYPAQRSWEDSLLALVQRLQRHTGVRATARRLRWADQLVGSARAAMVAFERICAACSEVISAEAALLVLNTYYQTGNLAQWTAALRALTEEVRARHRSHGEPQASIPRVLVIGSPILFPQYKVPGLIHDAGLRLLAAVDPASTSRYTSLTEQERHGTAGRLMRNIARKHYALDSSSAHVVNRAMEQYVEYLLSSMEVEGVVWHILKGQIEYDFELARMEPLFERCGIPVFRLETDYQYQDVEQLRIRLEAFEEMLEQRTFVASQAGVSLRCA